MRIDTTQWKRQAARMMDLKKWPDAEQFWKDQGKGAMKEIVARTAPNKGKTELASKKRGEATVEADIRKLFVPTLRRIVEIDLASIHKQHRNARGRVGRSLGKGKHTVRSAALNHYIRDEKKDVGKLAGGFNAASAKLGYRPPAWIWRHNSPGSMTMKVTSHGIRIRATNRVRYASNVKGLERRIQVGIHAQERKLRREVDFLLQRQARRAEFRAR